MLAHRALVPAIVLLLAFFAGGPAPAAFAAGERDVLSSAQAIRRAGCAQRSGLRTALIRDARLDQVAAAWSRGGTLSEALQRTDVRVKRSASLRIGNTSRTEQSLRSGLCTALTTADYASLGVHAGESQTWVVVAQLFSPPPPSAAHGIAERSLLLVNRARGDARRCGSQPFAAAPPLRGSPTLAQAALAQAKDLAANSVLSHRGSDGSDPGARATRAGYRWRVVGENVASGPQSAEEVIAGWLHSPDHCENIMDPRYTEMGIAYAVNTRSSGIIYWSQVFGLPR
ncbi:MAG: CAP domain-containing protein [Steroidobacteraceae bacterium]